MTVSKFCVDELAFSSLRDPHGALVAQLEPLVCTLEDLHMSQLQPILMRQQYEVTVDSNGTNFATFLYGDPAPSERDLIRRLQVAIDRCAQVAWEGELRPPATRVSNQMDSIDVASYAFAYAVNTSTRDKAYYAIVCRGDSYRTVGAVLLSRNGRQVQALVLINSSDIPLAFRGAIEHCDIDERTFFELATLAFPHLLLHETLSFRKFSNGFRGCYQIVRKHLTFLNDEFLTLGIQTNWDHPTMMGLASLSFSDESAKTKANARAMRQRQVMIRGTKVTCTLHTKLKSRQDRIHFHPPIRQIDANRVIIGIFAEHLLT
jgi:hypothetical protein